MAMLGALVALLLTHYGSCRASSQVVINAAPNSATLPALDEALRIAARSAHSLINLQPGVYRVKQPVKLPAGSTLLGRGLATVSGGIEIGPWKPVPDRDWLFSAALPAELWGVGSSQLFVNGQRRGVARSSTMQFTQVTATGLQAAAGQILQHYENQTALRCVTYQHWTAAITRVESVNATTGQITLERKPDPMTGDESSGSRYFLENAPEYLHAGSGTFYANQQTGVTASRSL